MKRAKSDMGVSPVIGVVLLVAVTVALVSLVAVVAFDTIDSVVSETADAEIQLSFEIDAGADGRIGYLYAEVARNQNVDTILVETPSGNSTTISNVGDSATLEVYEEGTAFAKAQDENFDEVISSINVEV